MKAIVRLPLTKNIKVNTQVGSIISPDSGLFTRIGEKEEFINLSEILKISPHNVTKYLRKKIGDTIEIGSVIAGKKGLLSQITVKSPISGVVKGVDLTHGYLIIQTQSEESQCAISIPVKGTIKVIGNDHVDIEINGIKMEGQKGAGDDAVGLLYVLPDKTFSLMDFDADVEDCIIMTHTLRHDMLVKLQALFARGVISTKFIENSGVSLLKVTDDNFQALQKYEGKKVWLRPSENRIYILEKE